ncbi:hypothetical protein [Nonomuraea soli]|uniref:DnaJ-class molecular chaperone n=1 Tax=Nonomuraea soli TaxID=1032476 RepID=A0A7W0HV04_9ACTN|nr:hypothetical protein [Nonomuraea soli]MBA2896650.1 DnaJ-class molecular chaperone [Nonomuraea soli]
MSNLAMITAAVIGGTLLPLAVVLAIVGYRHGLTRNPFTDCRLCQGTGVKRGALFTRSFRFCHACDATGLTLRLGVRMFNIPVPADQEHLRRLRRDRNSIR